MTPARMWMIRAGRNARAIDDFLDEEIVAMGNPALEDLPLGASKEQVLEHVKLTAPTRRRPQLINAAGQLYRFLTEIQEGEEVCTYDSGQRRYLLGRVLAGDGHREQLLNRYRKAEWVQHVARDGLTMPTKNSLGSTLALFLVPEAAASELRAKAIPLDRELEPGKLTSQETESDGTEATEEAEYTLEFDAISSKADELIEDALNRLDWEEMQELMAGVLRGMGFRTQVSPKGADRGVDILASPDGIGLQEPRVFVEVKHRQGSTMGAGEVRAFLGGRQSGDRCLYLSTGGFTKEARYEAERSKIPITLIDLPRFRELLIEHYDRLDSSASALIPLQRIYWPVA